MPAEKGNLMKKSLFVLLTVFNVFVAEKTYAQSFVEDVSPGMQVFAKILADKNLNDFLKKDRSETCILTSMSEVGLSFSSYVTYLLKFDCDKPLSNQKATQRCLLIGYSHGTPGGTRGETIEIVGKSCKKPD